MKDTDFTFTLSVVDTRVPFNFTRRSNQMLQNRLKSRWYLTNRLLCYVTMIVHSHFQSVQLTRVGQSHTGPIFQSRDFGFSEEDPGIMLGIEITIQECTANANLSIPCGFTYNYSLYGTPYYEHNITQHTCIKKCYQEAEGSSLLCAPLNEQLSIRA